jgi:gluconate 5-dehydrogenase
MAEALAEVGATVVLNGRDASTLRVVAGGLRDRGLKVEALAFDVTDLNATSAAIGSVVANYQR